MTTNQKNSCHKIIHSYSAAAATAASGLAQIPASDSAILIPLQVAMVITLGSVFGIELTKSAARATLASATSTFIGRGIAQFLFAWIPILGNVFNAITAAFITETIGFSVANDFAHQYSKKKNNIK